MTYLNRKALKLLVDKELKTLDIVDRGELALTLCRTSLTTKDSLFIKCGPTPGGGGGGIYVGGGLNVGGGSNGSSTVVVVGSPGRHPPLGIIGPPIRHPPLGVTGSSG